MSRKQRERRDIAAAQNVTASKRLRLLVPVMLVLAVAALGLNIYWWQIRPRLEPLPVVSLDSLDPSVQAVLEKSIAAVSANNLSAMSWGELGAVLRAHDFGAEAEVCYRNAERLDGKDYRWPYLLGVSLVTTDTEQATECFRRAANLCGEQPHVQLRLAEILMELEQKEEATQLIEKVLTYAPSNPRGQLAKARLLFAEGKIEDAKSWAEKSAAGAADRRAPHLLLAQLCRRTGDKQGEARELELLKEIPDGVTPWEDPDVASVLNLRQDLAARLANAESQAQLLQDISGAEDSSPAIQVARAYFKNKEYAAAESILRAMLNKFPDDERLHFEVGVACYQQKKYEIAAKEFTRAIELKPDRADARYNLGHALLKLDKKLDAREAFAAAVRLQPSHAFARVNLADLLLEAGQPVAAREQLEIAVRLSPQDVRARQLLAKTMETSKP